MKFFTKHRWKQGAVLYYAFAMTVPNILLIYSEGFSWWVTVANLMLPFGAYMALSICCRQSGIPILASLPLMVLGAFQIVVWSLFRGSIVAIDMVTNLGTTNVSEATELLASLMPAIVGVCVLYLPLLFIGTYFLYQRVTFGAYFRKKVAIWTTVVLLTGVFALFLAYRADARFEIKKGIFPANIIYNINESVVRWDRVTNYHNTSKNFTHRAHRADTIADRKIFIVVLGEASRAASWQLYGYGRETNPCLAARKDLILFKDVLVESNTTHKSVPMLLSSVSAVNYDSIYYRKGVIDLFNEVGYKTFFFSNQVPNRSLVDLFGDEAQKRVDICPKDEELFSNNFFDQEVFPLLQEAFRGSDDLFIVVHTRGSHFDFRTRYPRQFAVFQPDEYSNVTRSDLPYVINAYDNSIVYTDYVLSCIIDLTEKQEAVSGIFYISDHGEDLMDDARNRFLHSAPTTTYYQLHVPHLLWFSPKYIARYPEVIAAARSHVGVPFSSSSSFATLALMAGIRTPYLEEDTSPLSAKFSPAKRLYLNDYQEGVSVVKTGLTSFDFDEFARRGIQP